MSQGTVEEENDEEVKERKRECGMGEREKDNKRYVERVRDCDREVYR